MKIGLVEVGARDGLQNESLIVPTATKIALIERLIAAGLRRIEVASFVHPKRVPQMADAEAVLAGLTRTPSVSFIGLVLNRKGFERARAAGCHEVGMALGASDEFNRRNQGVDTAESIAVWREIARDARAAGIKAHLTISTAFGCPFEGEVDPDRVMSIARGVRCRRADRNRSGRHDRRRRAYAGDGLVPAVEGNTAGHAAACAFPQHAQHRYCQRLRGVHRRSRDAGLQYRRPRRMPICPGGDRQHSDRGFGLHAGPHGRTKRRRARTPDRSELVDPRAHRQDGPKSIVEGRTVSASGAEGARGISAASGCSCRTARRSGRRPPRRCGCGRRAPG